MNIFVTDADPRVSAANLDDKRVVKMVLESAQLLSTVMHIYGDGDKAPYRPTHQNHPCTIWAAESRENASWLFEHFEALLCEYARRYPGKQHKCGEYEQLFRNYFYSVSLNYPKQFCNCTPYKDIDSVQIAYQLYMNDKWDNDKRTPTWYGEGR